MPALLLLEAHDRRIEPIWRALEAATSPPVPYVLSWGWIENWLACLPTDEAPKLAVLQDPAGPVAACFVHARPARRRFAPAIRALHLNATSEPDREGWPCGPSGLLRVSGARGSLTQLVELLPDAWDELYLSAVDLAALPELSLPEDQRALRVRIDRERPAPFVDLDTVRSVTGGYLAILPARVRAPLLRERDRLGGLALEVATDERHALDIFDELVRLHRRRWHLRGEPGAFGDPWLGQFHRRLIASRLRHGEIQLIRVRARGLTVGCLYNFVLGDHVSFFQSGLAASPDPRFMPGELCHAEAVELNAAAGKQTYELLGDGASAPRRLATGERRLVWLRVQRPGLRFAIEDRVRRLEDALARWRDHRLVAGVPSRA